MAASEAGQDVAAAFAELAETLASDPDLGAYLDAACRHCVALAGVDHAVIVHRDAASDGARQVAASGEMADALVSGCPDPAATPWAECMATGQPVPAADLRDSRDRWPWFSGHALAAGLRTVTALPLGTHAEVTGALVLLGGAAPDPAGIGLAAALADAAGAGIVLAGELQRQQNAIAQLQSALTSRIVIEQAKGMLAERWKVTPDEAFDALRRLARTGQRRLADLAVAVIEGRADVPTDITRPGPS